MENMINFGIDLGTTNSVIAKFNKGQVEVFKDPTYWQETLPSVVAFKKDEILVGKQAKARAGAEDFYTTFKRKMGTTESFKVKALSKSVTPIELSAYVLKELKTCVTNGESVDAAIITIPASFDIMQSNATKEAGYQAGFKQVILLAEPVAASMAYANKDKNLQDGQWLVYDLGGGTFDVALVKIHEGEMKVIDHEGDNFLGGSDFDHLIVEKLVVPILEKKYGLKNLWAELTSEKRRKDLALLVDKAEEVKKVLSARTSARFEISERDRMEDNNGDFIDEEITISRSEFEGIIKEPIEKTTEMINRIITRNKLMRTDLQFILMVGGSTYIPYVRKRVEELLQIPINCEIDPTTAVGIGAAYFAGTKKKDLSKQADTDKPRSKLQVRTSYPTASKDKEILFAAQFKGDINGLSYKITRDDGGYSSGTKPLQPVVNEELPLVENVFNTFTFRVYDKQGNEVATDIETIGINSGIGIGGSGNFLAHDICLELDDVANETTYSKLIFEKNATLPLITKLKNTLTKSILKGSDERLRINVLEGSSEFSPLANLPIGYFEITGKELEKDAIKSSDIELRIEISANREITVSVYLSMTNQEFTRTFKIGSLDVPIHKLKNETEQLVQQVETEIEEATKLEAYEILAELKKVVLQINDLKTKVATLNSNDTTDKKYQLEQEKKDLVRALENATRGKRLEKAKKEYLEAKTMCFEIVNNGGSEYHKKAFLDIANQETIFLTSTNPLKIKERITELHSIIADILGDIDEIKVLIFEDLVSKKSQMHPREQASILIDAGYQAVSSRNWDKLDKINFELRKLLPEHKWGGGTGQG